LLLSCRSIVHRTLVDLRVLPIASEDENHSNGGIVEIRHFPDCDPALTVKAAELKIMNRAIIRGES
jgi:hypothetical protein